MLTRHLVDVLYAQPKVYQYDLVGIFPAHKNIVRLNISMHELQAVKNL